MWHRGSFTNGCGAQQHMEPVFGDQVLVVSVCQSSQTVGKNLLCCWETPPRGQQMFFHQLLLW